MKKDVYLAVLVGFILGSASALLAVNLPSLIKRGSQPQITTADLTPTITPLSKTSPLLTIESPADESIASAKTIAISGQTTEGAILVLSTTWENNTQVASGSGSFSFPVSLQEGANTLVITAYNDSGESETKTLTVFYTTEKL